MDTFLLLWQGDEPQVGRGMQKGPQCPESLSYQKKDGQVTRPSFFWYYTDYLIFFFFEFLNFFFEFFFKSMSYQDIRDLFA